MIPIYGRERFCEIKELYEAGDPLPFAGGHYVIVAIEYDIRMECGSFSVQQVKLVDDPAKDTSVRDAVLSNLN
jgi:hypothetical protein